MFPNLLQHQGNVHVGRAGEEAGRDAIPHVVAEQEFQGGAPHGANLVGIAVDLHSLGNLCRTGGNQRVAFPVLDQTNLTGGGGFVATKETQYGDFDPHLRGGIQNRRTGRHIHFAAVNR